MPNFGYTSKGIFEEYNSVNYIRGLKALCPESGFAQSITAYFKQYGAKTPRIKCAVYTMGINGLPDRLLAKSEEWTLPAGFDGWHTFNLLSNPELQPNTYYWLIFWTSDEVYAYYVTGDLGCDTSRVYDDWADPFGNVGTQGRVHSIYCTYRTAAPIYHTLRVESTPISVPVGINGSPIGNTPIEKTVEEGTYIIDVPTEAQA